MLWIACAIAERYQAPYHHPLPETVRLHATETSRQAITRMAQWALQFTPSVTLEPSRDVLLIEVAASLKLWGGIDALIKRLANGWINLGWHAPDLISMAYGPTAKAAHWQAYANTQKAHPILHASYVQSIDQLPVAASQEAAIHRDTLARMGITTLGQVLRLPRQGITRRFGSALLDALDMAQGAKPDPRPWIYPAAQFHRGLELPARADNWRLIELGADRLFVELCAWLAAQHAGVRRLTITLKHDHPPHSDITLGFADNVWHHSRFSTVLKERLAREKLSRPVYEMELCAKDIEPICYQTRDLLTDQPAAEKSMESSFLELMERLTARLGCEHVRQLQIRDDHRPEAAQHEKPLDLKHLQKRFPQKEVLSLAWDLQNNSAHRPIWLLKPPLFLNTHADRPNYHGALRLLCGPERIESGWWEEDIDATVLRDYFIASSEREELLWIYRTPNHQWYLHGFFA